MIVENITSDIIIKVYSLKCTVKTWTCLYKKYVKRQIQFSTVEWRVEAVQKLLLRTVNTKLGPALRSLPRLSIFAVRFCDNTGLLTVCKTRSRNIAR